MSSPCFIESCNCVELIPRIVKYFFDYDTNEEFTLSAFDLSNIKCRGSKDLIAAEVEYSLEYKTGRTDLEERLLVIAQRYNRVHNNI